MALEKTDFYAYVVEGLLADPSTSDIKVNQNTPTTQYFLRPTTIGNASIGLGTSDDELALVFNVFRIWVDAAGDAPDIDSTLEQGELLVDMNQLRCERTDFWRPYTSNEIEKKRRLVKNLLRDDMTSRAYVVNEHLGAGSDGIVALRAIMKAGRDVSEEMTRLALEELASWLRANTDIDLPAFTEDGANGTIKVNMNNAKFEEQFRKQAVLASIEDIREAFVQVRNEVNALALYSELDAFDYETRMSELLGPTE